MKYPIETLNRHEINMLLRHAGRGKTAIRNRALIVVMYRAGLRCSEVLALMPKDIDWESGSIRVLHGKGDKARTVGIDEGGLDTLKHWTELRTKLGIGDDKPLFCTLQGEQVKDAYVREMLPRIAKRAGVNKRVHAHALRHTHATELAKEGVQLVYIQQQLGHSNIATTSRYLQHINPHEVVERINRRHWRAVI